LSVSLTGALAPMILVAAVCRVATACVSGDFFFLLVSSNNKIQELKVMTQCDRSDFDSKVLCLERVHELLSLFVIGMPVAIP